MIHLILVPSLRYGGAASQARKLALSLRHKSDPVHVVALRSGGPWEVDLREAGASVHVLNWTRTIELAPLWRLGEILRTVQPDLIHTLDLSTLRCLAGIGRNYLERTWAYRLVFNLISRTPVDQWLFRALHGAVACTHWEASLLEQAGFRGDRLCLLRPSLGPLVANIDERSSAEKKRLIVNVSRLEQTHGPRDALWTMDMMAYPFPDWELTIVGEGSLSPGLRELGRRVYYPDRTHFVPAVRDLDHLLVRASLCWITAAPGHGLQTALEAQALGCPIVGYDQPALRELVKDGETALLVPRGDTQMLARRSYSLLKDASLRTEMGHAARQWALGRLTARSDRQVVTA